jgi:hypothetical protein
MTNRPDSGKIEQIYLLMDPQDQKNLRTSQMTDLKPEDENN